jgi:hypothetical protein
VSELSEIQYRSFCPSEKVDESPCSGAPLLMNARGDVLLHELGLLHGFNVGATPLEGFEVLHSLVTFREPKASMKAKR